MTIATKRPLDRMLEFLPHATGPHGNGEWYNCPCPAHNDKNSSFGFKETENGGVAVNCFAGCSEEQILQSIGLEKSDLYPHGYTPSYKAMKPIELIDLAEYTRIYPTFLSNLGLVEGSCTYKNKETGKLHTAKGVKIPYYMQDGTLYSRYRLRTSLVAKNSKLWNPSEESNEPTIVYGLDRLEDARKAGYMFIVEGESDCWTLWYRGFPALGIPGATNEKLLDASYLDGIPTVYIVQEPDGAGTNFPERVYAQLIKTGYKGKVYSIDFHKETGEKDPNNLYKKDIKAFKGLFQALLDTPRTPMTTQSKQSHTLPAALLDVAYLDTKKVLDLLPQGEYGDSLVFTSLFKGKLVYDHAEKSWYYWDKHAWKKDETKLVRQLVARYVGQQYLDTASEIPRMAQGKTEEEIGRLAKLAKECMKRAVDVRNLRRIDNITTLAASHPEMNVIGNEWDSNVWVLGTPNGVIDLKTGTLRDGEPDEYIRTITNTEWSDINTPCPRWERFLQEIFDDQPDKEELISYLQRILGYGITGMSNQAVFPVLYGEEGRNGKSTLVQHLKKILGKTSGSIHNDVLIDAKGRTPGAAQPHLADLQGKRLVWVSETSEGARFNVSQVKNITGNDMIPARRNYENMREFAPTHTILLLTNHKPHGDATDKAFWERVKLIPFNLRFVELPIQGNERQRDATLDAALEQEYSGILAWLVRGCLDYQKQGLNTPACVRSATAAYQREEDVIEQFIEDVCELNEGNTTDASAFYLAYSAWAKEMNMYPMSSKAFGMRAKNRFEKKKGRQGYVYHGVSVFRTL